MSVASSAPVVLMPRGTKRGTRVRSRLGVASRLLLAFLGISGLAVVGAGVALLAFREIGAALESITEQRAPAALASQEVSRHAERIVAAAPALLAAPTTGELAERSRQIRAEGPAIAELLEELEKNGADRLVLEAMRSTVAGLQVNLDSLDRLVGERIALTERKRVELRGAFEAHAESQRLLAPWLQIVGDEVAQTRRILGEATASVDARTEAAGQLAVATATLGSLTRVQLLLTMASDRLQQIAVTEGPDDLRVLSFRSKQALNEARQLVAGVDARLRPLLMDRLEAFRAHFEAADSIPELRLQELAITTMAERLLAENATLSAKLTTAADRLIANVRHDITTASEKALSVQKLSSTILVSAVALSLFSSILIVWLYVGRSIVRRLAALRDAMLAIAEGKLDASVAGTGGNDEIAAMGRAVEGFRRNAIELERLLEERKDQATRLERVVEERTRELARRSSVLRVTFENMRHGVVMFDRERQMVAWNRRFQELLELPDDCVGPTMTYEGFVRLLAVRGEFGPVNIEAEVDLRLSSIDRPFNDERTRPNGTVIEIRRNPVPGGGFVSIYADVTEQRRAHALVEIARARLMDAVESFSDGFALWDKDDRLAVVNRRCVEMLEAPDLFVIGTTFPDLAKAYSARVQYAGASGDVVATLEERIALHRNAPSACELRLADNRWLSIREFRTQEGGTVTIWSDITAVKQREQDLEEARDAAAEASRTMARAYDELKAAQANLIHAEKMASLGQLTAGIAHEIKNPLNFVNNFAGLSGELLGELTDALVPAIDSLDATRRADVSELMQTLGDNLTKIVEHGRRADGIVRSMLLHSRGGSSERQSVNLNALLEEALNLAFHGARAQDQTFNITLERDFDPGLQPLDIAPQDITRVFLNLFGNAFYATKKRAREAGADYRPTLLIVTRDLYEAVEVRVRDNGVGISPEVRSKMFTPFFTTKPTGEGTGLGLSISYDIVVQVHGGALRVDSRLGEYTEFLVRLPRAMARGGKVDREAIAAGEGAA